MGGDAPFRLGVVFDVRGCELARTFAPESLGDGAGELFCAGGCAGRKGAKREEGRRDASAGCEEPVKRSNYQTNDVIYLI